MAGARDEAGRIGGLIFRPPRALKPRHCEEGVSPYAVFFCFKTPKSRRRPFGLRSHTRYRIILVIARKPSGRRGNPSVSALYAYHGLLRRCAPRNDELKQPAWLLIMRARGFALLAMTRQVLNPLSSSPRPLSGRRPYICGRRNKSPLAAGRRSTLSSSAIPTVNHPLRGNCRAQPAA